ncbi:MAG TPA: Gfo/Idh/MocA family oxidoreductase [Caldilineaceae bacterium]|nr:Gfo/Idh/MocA family oxidoreductase [Caldilineaceae bacterium]
MTAQTPLRVGLIGCGAHGRSLAEALLASPLWQLVACADPDPAARAAVASERIVPYPAVEELLTGTAVDAVVLATPPDCLYETALAAIQAHKHVLAEKPIGMDETEAAQLAEAVARAGVCYMAGYSFRFCPAVQQLHTLLHADVVGEVVAVQGSIGVAPLNLGWHASPLTGGGPLLYVGSHLVDEILWTVEDLPEEVTAHARYRADTGADETVSFQIRFSRGAMATGLVTQAADGFFNHLELYGRDGRISLRGVDYLHYTLEVISKTLPAYVEPTIIHPRVYGDPKRAMLTAELAAFAQAIHERRPPIVTVHDGQRVLRVLDGILESARRGATVWLQ